MIVLEGVTKTILVHNRKETVLSAVSIEIPSDRRIAVFSPQATHLRILTRLLGGIEKPTVGRIARFADVSFPVGFLPGLSKELSVRSNVAHVARLYGADVWRTLNLVEMVLGIGPRFDRPYEELNNLSRRQLADVVPLCLPFDTYLFADDRLVRRWRAEMMHEKEPDVETRIATLFNTRFQNAGMIIPTADANFARQHCDMSLIVDRERLVFAENTPTPDSEEQGRLRKRARPAIQKQTSRS